MCDKYPGVYRELFTRDFERLQCKITQQVCDQLDANGYAIIDDCFGHGWASALLQEMQWLYDKQHFKPNKTQFTLTQTPGTTKRQTLYFVKPHIFEVDLHDVSLRSKVPELNALFQSTELLQVLTTYLPHYKLQFSTSDRTLKLQCNVGQGGCFPCHYDNPGPPNKRKVTLLLYLNESWQESDDGQVQLYPFLQPRVTIAPKMDRVVLFQSDCVLHRVLPSYSKRYVLTIWLDSVNVNAPEEMQLRLTPNDMVDWNGFIKRLQRSPVQRVLSRSVYEEEYYESLMECLQSTATEGCVELLKSHETHLENVKRNRVLHELIQRLRHVRSMNTDEPVYLD